LLLNGQPYDDDIQPGERFPVNNMQIIDIFPRPQGGGMGGMGMGGMGMGRGT